MGTAKQVQPAKLVISLLAADVALLDRVREALERLYGPVDLMSDLLPFDHTTYYEAEFGTGLQRQIVTFERLIDPARLPEIKLQTNEIEWSLAKGDRRVVNIDPGYVSLGKLVLATTKDHAHRIYLGQGIYGEGTLTYQRGRFRPWPWTYPDYGSDEYCALVGQIRERYKEQLKCET
ncbi:MAG: DUF4416 family protein [Anaerolineae bacterium]|nr:DUF4416 family protein [Anaerolineae bacterium]